MTSPIRGHLAFPTLALAVGFSALAAGGIHLPVLVIYAVLVVASGLLVRFFPPEPAGRFDFGTLGVAAVALALALICLLQALPLPLDWLSTLAPTNADIWARALRLFQHPTPSFASLSLAPGRSVLEALQLASYAVVFAVAAQLSRAHGAQRLFWLAFGCALAVAVVTAAHQLLGAERLYGLYRPMSAYSVAPLLNPNNRAGYLNLGFFCGLGLLFRPGSRPYLGLIVLGLCFLAAEVILCRSLGGTSSLAIGFMLLLVLVLPGSLRRTQRRTGLPPLAQAGILTGIGGGAVLLALVGQGSAPLGLDVRAWEKADLWRRAGRLTSDHFFFGVGRGAFSSVFPAYQEPGKNVVFEHAENFPLQWAAEWGVPITVVALLALAWSLRPLLSQQTLRSSTRRCALIGCAVLLLQNLADLGLELPAVTALLCVVLGALCGAANEHEGDDGLADEIAPPRNGVLLAACGVAVACLALTIIFGSDSPPRLRRNLYDQLGTSGPPPLSFWASLERAVREYPAEPYFPLLGSSASLAAGRDPLPWIARALERNPQNAPTHLQLARILRARGANAQAFGAIRQALELDPSSIHAVLALAHEWKLNPSAFEAAAPIGRAGVPLLLLLATRTGDVAARRHLLEEALTRDPEAADAHYRLAEDLLGELSLNAKGACSHRREDCLAELAEHVNKAAVPGNSRAVVLQSRLLAEHGQQEQAELYLANECQRFPGDSPCLAAWVARALRNDSNRLPDAVKAYVATGCTDAVECASTHMGLGTLFANAGRWHSALTHYQHAAGEAPSPESWQAVARAADALGDHATAQHARQRIALFAPNPSATEATSGPNQSETPKPPMGPATEQSLGVEE